jgi:hypothetical protein
VKVWDLRDVIEALCRGLLLDVEVVVRHRPRRAHGATVDDVDAYPHEWAVMIRPKTR